MRVVRFTRLQVCVVVAMSLFALLTGLVLALDAEDVRVTRDATLGSYGRYDGGTDAILDACSTGQRSQVEPTIAVDPRDPNVIVVGAIDLCRSAGTNTLGRWLGYYRSTDGGVTWQNSLLPGYPEDDSPAGLASPMRGFCNRAVDPTQSFDRDGRLFYGFLCSNNLFETPDLALNASVLVATYDDDGSHYVRTVLVGEGTPAPARSVTGLRHDKPNLVVDQTNGPGAGNVYFAWTRFSGLASTNYPPSVVMFSRSTDHGATFSRPTTVVAGERGGLFTDLTVGPDGVVYLVWRTNSASEEEPGDSVWLARSSDFGSSFGKPQLVGTIDVFDSFLFSGNGDYACGVLSPCPSGLTFAPFLSNSAVVADESGVHVVWGARGPNGQSKIFVRNSLDGVTFAGPAQQIDAMPTGHQWLPDIASADGRITVVFFDSREDPAYSPRRPPANTAGGFNSGDVVNVWRAVSGDGGVTWAEERVSTVSFNPNWVTGTTPFAGDYLYVSAVPGRVWTAWSDSRNIVPWVAPIFVPLVPCDLANLPPSTDTCFSLGGLDWNIYARRLNP